MNIAIVTPGWMPVPAIDGGAVEVLITNIIEGNEREGKFQIDLYTKNSQKLDTIIYKKTNIIQIKPTIITKFKCRIKNTINKIRNKNYTEYSYNAEIIRNLRKQKYDYVVVENNIFLYRDVYYKTSNKDNIIYHIHNDIMKPNDKLCKLVCSTAKKILAVSEYIKKTVKKVDSNSDVEVLYNCVDLELFSNKNIIETKKDKIIDRYGIESNDIIFMFTGRINKEKGVLELIKAFKEVSYISNIKLMIVGSSWFNIVDEDEYLKSVKKESEEIKDKIVFTGYIYPNDMPLLYSLANVVIVPSIVEEAFGVVALEAMAMELPLIITNSGGLPEVINNECAICIEKGNNLIKELSIEIKKMAEDISKIKKMGENSRLRVISIQEFDKENYFNNFYNKIIDKEIYEN